MSRNNVKQLLSASACLCSCLRLSGFSSYLWNEAMAAAAAVAVAVVLWLSVHLRPRPKTMLVQTERQTRDDTLRCFLRVKKNMEAFLLSVLGRRLRSDDTHEYLWRVRELEWWKRFDPYLHGNSENDGWAVDWYTILHKSDLRKDPITCCREKSTIVRRVFTKRFDMDQVWYRKEKRTKERTKKWKNESERTKKVKEWISKGKKEGKHKRAKETEKWKKVNERMKKRKKEWKNKKEKEQKSERKKKTKGWKSERTKKPKNENKRKNNKVKEQKHTRKNERTRERKRGRMKKRMEEQKTKKQKSKKKK